VAGKGRGKEPEVAATRFGQIVFRPGERPELRAIALREV